MYGKIKEIYTSGVRLDNWALISWEELEDYFARQRRFRSSPLYNLTFDKDPRDALRVGADVWYDGALDGGIYVLEVYDYGT